jgi:predicted negative regulator of RcsB-dependent stress response
MVGRFRLAKIYLYQAKPQQAIDLLSGFEDSAFAARYNELLGDSHAALGQITEAAAAYQRAMTDDSMVPTINRALIQMKIVDLPDKALVDKPTIDEIVSDEVASDDNTAELAVESEGNQ